MRTEEKSILQKVIESRISKHESFRGLSPSIKTVAEMSADKALEYLKSTQQGLNESEVAERQKKYGLNRVSYEQAPRALTQLLRAFATPFTAVLVVIMLVSVFTDIYVVASEERSYKTVIILALMICISGLLRFFTEFRSTKAAEALKHMVTTTAAVRRISSATGASERLEVPLEDVVPGDIIYLGAGDMVPGDIRLLSSKDLTLSQSILTGESVPVDKSEVLSAATDKSAEKSRNGAAVLDMPQLCFMGTNVVAGTGVAVVAATGPQTYFGAMAKSILGQRELTSFDRGVRSVSWLLIRFMLVMVPIIFIVNGVLKGDWVEAFLFGIAIAVGLTPEMLPTIVSANLAKGALRMARKKCIVKRINSIQNLGAMDVLCADKTGTLTRDKIILERYLDISGNKNPDVLDYAYLNSFHQTGLKNLLDRAVLERCDIQQGARRGRNFEKVDEVPFDFNRKRMSVILKESELSHLLICKGAVEEVIQYCSSYDDAENGVLDTIARPLTPEEKEKALSLVDELNNDGLRVVAVAIKDITDLKASYSVADESDMSLCGFVAFMDPPKESAEAAIKTLVEHGVQVKVLTGDGGIIARNVCRQVGLESKSVILGSQIEKMSEEEIRQIVVQENIFAKLSPLQKSQIVKALQSVGHTVGFLGDGINDASALRDADVGISVDSAADIVKESADIIMLEKDLMVLQEGVMEGRNVFGNIIKYIKMAASSNFGNVFSVLVASAFLPFLPMLPIHILIQNMLYDLSQTTLPFDRVDPEYLAKPRKWEANNIGRFMIWLGPLSSIFDVITFAVMWFVLKANTPEHQSLFQSGWFVEGLLSQTLVVHMIRTQKIPFLQSRAATPVLIATVIVGLIGLAIPYTKFGAAVGLIPLPGMYFPWLLVILLTYFVSIQMLKQRFIARFKSWI